MKHRLVHEQNGQRTYVVIFDAGDEARSGLEEFAENENLADSHFTAIGAFSEATFGYFDWGSKEYKHIPIKEQVEVLSLAGDIACSEGSPKVHAHVVVGKSDGTAHGGHLCEAYVRPTLEVVLTESPGYLKRKRVEEWNLALIEL